MSGTVGGCGAGEGDNVVALDGLGGSMEEKDCDLLCPVCFELIDEAYVTRCGHSFCFGCVSRAVELHRRCPKCGAALPGRDHIFPNLLLNELVAKRRVQMAASGTSSPSLCSAPAPRLRALVQQESARLAMPDVDCMLDVLTKRKQALQAQCAAAHHRLLYEFLCEVLRMRTAQLEQVSREAALVRADMDTVAAQLRALHKEGELGASLETESVPSEAADEHSVQRDIIHRTDSGCGLESGVAGSGETAREERFASVGEGDLMARWRRLMAHADDLVQCYFAHRADELYFPGSSGARCSPHSAAHTAAPHDDNHSVPQANTHHAHSAGDQRLPLAEQCSLSRAPSTSARSLASAPAGLDAFREDLAAFTRYRALRPLATLSYCSDAINYSTIVSTIEFDKDYEFFAIAGVTKRIKVFEYESVVRDAVDVHYPCAEMQCSHKISCVTWNAYHKHVLASSDYEGTVSVWDVATAARTRALHEHDKRCWSVHFNRCDVRLLASGSDDARVKLWALNTERSVATLEAKFNVCCVRFNPKSSAHLAFGSADHCVHYYDLRAPRAPLAVFKDHRKAVSYVKFLDGDTLVSASTDSHLKLWKVGEPTCVRSFTEVMLHKAVSYVKFLDGDTVVSASTDSHLKLWKVGEPTCVRSFTGHANEKNFVGLATDGKYIACGSENNALYVYYWGLSRPLLAYRFEAARPLLERAPRDEEPSEFVSAVCWRTRHQPALLAANSQGTIKVLEMI